MKSPPRDTGGTEVVVADELMTAFVTHRDADVTVVIGYTLVDISGVSFDGDREKFVLHILAEDLADAIRKLVRDGSTADQITEEATGVGGL